MNTGEKLTVRITQKQGRWFATARVLVVALLPVLLLIFILGSLNYFAVGAAHPELFSVFNWTPREMDIVLAQVGMTYLSWLQFRMVASIVFALIICAIAVFLFLRRGSDWFGLFLAITLMMFGTLSGHATVIVADVYPALAPLVIPLGNYAWLSLFILTFLFPNGLFVPGWTRMVVIALFIAFGVNFALYQGKTPPALLFFPLISLAATGPLSQVYRYYRVSNSVERQQTRIVIWAMVMVLAFLLITSIPLLMLERMDPAEPLALLFLTISAISQFIMGLIPFSIAIAILRYRLWDIDLVIRRTLIYTVLTVLLALVYYGLVTLLQTVFAGASRQQPLLVVISTLASAALFSPLRRHIQDVIDRRFFRQKYDVTVALEEFSSAARQEVELGALTIRMVGVVEKAIQPQQVSVWLRDRRMQA